MGFILTLIYVALALLSPEDFVHSLGEYRVELLVVLLTLIVSAPGLMNSRFFWIPQNYLLAGLFIAVFLSIAVADHWVGGGWQALQRFMPAAIVLYLVVLNCQSLRRLQALVWVLAVIGAFYVVQGTRAYNTADANQLCRDGRIPTSKLTDAQADLPVCNPLLEAIPVGDGTITFRMQGMGFLRDPNELAQLLVTVLPFMWIAWRAGRYPQNFVLVVLPTALFVWGIYLTHSRGAILALVVILVIALKDRVSAIFSVVGGAVAFCLMLLLNFSGGREISVEAGSNRLMLWGNGLELFKESPLFGIGFQGFMGQNAGHTAHNSFVVCLAELGIFGYAFWIALIVFSLVGLNSLIAALRSKRANAVLGDHETEASELEDAELDKWARAVRISLFGFLAAGFFLSRAYSLTLYLVLGIAATVLYMVPEQEELPAPDSLPRLFAVSAGVGFVAIALVYVSLRARALF